MWFGLRLGIGSQIRIKWRELSQINVIMEEVEFRVNFMRRVWVKVRATVKVTDPNKVARTVVDEYSNRG